MTTKTERAAERGEAIADLRAMLTDPNPTVYVMTRHVARSGMTRWIDLYTIATDRDGRPYLARITWSVARALGWTYDGRHDALKVHGAGMDMHFHTVYELGCVLWPDETRPGYRIDKRTL